MTQTTTTAIATAPRGPAAAAPWVGLRLSIMMFLQWATLGVYGPILSVYLQEPAAKGGLGFTGNQVGWITGLAGATGAIAAPFVAGQVADRYLNAERAMAVLLLAGGLLQLALAPQTGYGAFVALSMFVAVAFAPTQALTNSISFHSLDDKERRFPLIRAWGTIGWVVASGLFGTIWLSTRDPYLKVHRMADALRVSGALAIIYAVYCLLALPKTPPKRSVEHPLAFTRAFRLFLHPGFLVVALVTLPISMVHGGYFIRAAPFLKQEIHIPEEWIGWVMGIGQASEVVVFLAALGLLLKRLGYRWVLAIGGLGYVVRYAVFAIGGPPWLVVAAQACHGVCYGCFYAGAFLYIERIATADIRHSAQIVYALVLVAGGMLASIYNGLFDRFTKEVEVVQLVAGEPVRELTKVQSYTEFWAVSAGVALLATVALVVFFKPGLPRGAGGVESGE